MEGINVESVLKVGDAMTKSPIYISADATIHDCVQKMRNNEVGNLIILDGKKLRGIITERDIIYKVIAEKSDPSKIKAKDIMSDDVATISPEEDIQKAIKRMRDISVRRLPVVENDKLVGVLSVKDVLRVEPQLFDIISEKFVVWDMPKFLQKEGFEGNCEMCGNYSSSLSMIDGSIYCNACNPN